VWYVHCWYRCNMIDKLLIIHAWLKVNHDEHCLSCFISMKQICDMWKLSFNGERTREMICDQTFMQKSNHFA